MVWRRYLLSCRRCVQRIWRNNNNTAKFSLQPHKFLVTTSVDNIIKCVILNEALLKSVIIRQNKDISQRRDSVMGHIGPFANRYWTHYIIIVPLSSQIWLPSTNSTSLLWESFFLRSSIHYLLIMWGSCSHGTTHRCVLHSTCMGKECDWENTFWYMSIGMVLIRAKW